MRTIPLLFAIVFLVGLAGYIVRPSSATISTALYIVAVVLGLLLILGLVGLG